LAGLSIGVVNALFNSPWGTFTVLATMPIAVLMGLHMHVFRKGDVLGASIMGVVLLFLTLLAGPHIAANPTWSRLLTLSRSQLAVVIPVYGFAASALPVWLLLVPRDYLSTYLKLGVIIMLVGGIAWVHPTLQMASLTPYIHGGGPIIPGSVFPFIFITIACGALSGFHAIIGTGTTPKMIANEKDILFVGYGAMLVEGVVAIMALIAACVLVPSDYFAINALPKAYAALHMTPVHLPALGQLVGEQLQGRPGGAVSLAVGMSYIFTSIPFMKNLAAYWYHFAIMFEAVFILTAVDSGTRVGRYMLQEMLGKVWPRFDEKKWMPGILLTSLLFTASLGYLVYTGDISTIWPLFGMANQLLATCALIVGTTMLIRHGKVRYAWTTGVPGLFMIPVTLTAGYENIVHNYVPKGMWLLVAFSVVLMILMSIVFVEAFVKWYHLLHVQISFPDRHGELVLLETEE
jgi:carbon starvation protein